MMQGGGLSLQINEVHSKIVLDQFLLDSRIKAVGTVDNTVNNEAYNYLTIGEVVATPWDKNNPIKPLGYPEGFLKIMDIVALCPLDTEAQQKIQLMPHSEQLIMYVGRFVIQAKLSMGDSMTLAGVLDSLDKRFLAVTEMSLFPMFPAGAGLSGTMPVGLVNRALISHYHPVS
jgi:hypothetical protein